jgi:HemY protein
MIRLAIFLVLAAAVAAVAVWFADRPGEVAITWIGHRIETSVGVLVGAIALIAAVTVLVVGVVRIVLGIPATIARKVKQRREARGREAISRGLVAIGAGDVAAAQRFAALARHFAGDEALVLLLTAQTAQIAGEGERADAAFRTMAAAARHQSIGPARPVYRGAAVQ